MVADPEPTADGRYVVIDDPAGKPPIRPSPKTGRRVRAKLCGIAAVRRNVLWGPRSPIPRWVDSAPRPPGLGWADDHVRGHAPLLRRIKLTVPDSISRSTAYRAAHALADEAVIEL